MKSVNSSTNAKNLGHPGHNHKHPYRAPTLKEYGSLAELTKAGGGTFPDNPLDPFSFTNASG